MPVLDQENRDHYAHSTRYARNPWCRQSKPRFIQCLSESERERESQSHRSRPQHFLSRFPEKTASTQFGKQRRGDDVGRGAEEMMKRGSNVYGRVSESSSAAAAAAATSSSSAAAGGHEGVEWERRPGGMLVQKRDENPDLPAAPNVRVRVAYGKIRYEISVNSQATFGELKKLLAAETGLQAAEQRLAFRGKDRDDGEYLDKCGVKDRSKLSLVQDPISIERRLVEMRRNARIQTVHRAVTDVAAEVDKLADQVSAMEKSIAKGNKMPEVQITTLIEMLMRQAVKLDSISAEGDAAPLKNLQGKRVQKCVETLDMLKVSNARIKPVIVTTKWETFDHPPPTAAAAANATNPWEFFD